MNNSPTTLVEEAIAAVRKLPPENQDEIARLMLSIVKGALSPPTLDEVAGINEAEAEIAAGERVPPQIVQAFWRAHGL